MQLRSHEGPAHRVPDGGNLAAGHEIPFDLGIAHGVDTDRAAGIVGGDLTAARDPHAHHPVIRTIECNIRIKPCQITDHHCVLGLNIASRFHYCAQQGSLGRALIAYRGLFI